MRKKLILTEAGSSSVSNIFYPLLTGISLFVLLFIISQYNYLIFHTLAELFSIVIAWSLFIIVWNTRKAVKNDALVFLGIAFLSIGCLDLFHTLSYKGMGVLSAAQGANPATQLYIIARYMESITLCLFPFFLEKRIKYAFPIAIYSIITSMALLSVFVWKIFPACYAEGIGLTMFKKSSAYIICMFLGAALFFLSKKKNLLDETTYKFLFGAIIVAILSELAFTFYFSVYGLSNLIGHFLKILSFYLIYKAIIYTGLRKPYTLMFKKLSESEDRFKKFSNLTFEGILIHKKGAVIYVNKAFKKMTGYMETELIGENLIDDVFIPFEYQAVVKENIIKNRMMPYEIMARKKNGQLFPIEIESKKIELNGNAFRVTAIRDISKRKTAENKLKKNEQELKSIFRVAPTGIGVVRGRILYQLNDRFCEMTGYSKNELTGQNARMLYPNDEEYDYVGTEKYRQIRDKGTGTVETKWQCKDGKIINVLLSSTPIYQDDLSKGVTFTALDITAFKKKELELLESKEKYRSIMKAMDDSAYLCSSDFVIEYMNPAMIKWMGGDATGELCHKVVYGLDEKCPWCIHEKVIQGETIKTEIVSPKDDKSYHISHSPVFHADGSVSKMSVFRDITKIKTMEARIQQSQKMEAIGTLAGGIAHDFNNILFPIIGHTEILLEDIPEDSPFRHNLNGIHTSALRAGELVKQILTFARQDTNELKLMKMQPIIKEALKLIRASIPTTIDIKQNIQADCGVVKANPTEIHQIVMNLTTNAFHAMEKKGGRLTVTLKEIQLDKRDACISDLDPGKYACLTVSDTGIGMDKQLMKKIFDPFFTTKKKGKGTGMGLSVVHGIVKCMGGIVQVYSEPGKGTEFHVYLPVVKNSYENHALQTKEPIQRGIETILLVDDEAAILTMEKQILERLGYKVNSRTSSVEALEAFRKNPDKFDLVITDMAMPNMPGDMLATELIRIRPDIPVLLCTGFSETMSEEKAASIGIKGFLLKPIVMKDLSQKIREILDRNN